MCALRDKPRWFMLDGTARFRRNGQPLHHFLQVAGYATHAVLPEQSVIPIRKDAPLDVVCLVSCGVLAGAGPVFNRAKVPPGASVAVWGCGGVGLNTIQAARMLGAGKIIAVDVMRQKLAWAEEFGATHVVDASKEDPVAARPGAQRHRRSGLHLRGGGHPEDHRAGAPGHPPRRHLRDRGRLPAGTRVSLDPSLLLQQRVLTGSSFGGGHQRTDVPMLIDLYMSGKYKLDELISRRLPLSELNEALRPDAAGRGEAQRDRVLRRRSG